MFYAFDLLELDGEDIARLPQIERKERLEALLANLPPDAPIAYSEHIVGQGEEVLQAMRDGGHEGVIAKFPSGKDEHDVGAWVASLMPCPLNSQHLF